jgi:hypothetical protein
MRSHLLILSGMLSFAAGCGVQEPTQWKEWRDQFALREKPEDAISISEAIARTGDDDIVVIAQVGSGKGDAFDNKVASFLVSEAPDKEHMGKPGHDDNCPFCKQKLANAPTVTVGFSNSDGQPIPVDARKLFGIKKGDIVVIKGKGSYEDSAKTLSINATGLQIANR